MPKKQVASAKKSATRVHQDRDEENTPIDNANQDQIKNIKNDEAINAPKDNVLQDKTNVNEEDSIAADVKNLGKRKATHPAGQDNVHKKIKGNEGQAFDKNDDKINIEGQTIKKDVLMGPSKEDVADQFTVEIKYSSQTKSYESGMKVILEHLEANYPGLEVKQTKSSDKELFNIMLQRKDDKTELIAYSKGILGDVLPTKRNAAKFDDKFKKALIEMKQVECTMNKIEEVAKASEEANIPNEDRVREEKDPEAPAPPVLSEDPVLAPVISGEKALTEVEKIQEEAQDQPPAEAIQEEAPAEANQDQPPSEEPIQGEDIQGPLQPGTHQEVVNEVKEVEQNPIA